jgi:LuxR family transcriptional regulator, transcriptional regulator of spore coat protein
VQAFAINNLEVHDLPQRQAETLVLTAQGLSSKEVARAMGISSRTVEMNLHHSMLRLGARNRAHLVTQAIAAGILKIRTAAFLLLLCFSVGHAAIDDLVHKDQNSFVRRTARSARARRSNDSDFFSLDQYDQD